MKLIVSAYREGSSPSMNAIRTASLIRRLQGENLSTELCIGVYKGVREISIIATGMESAARGVDIAKLVLNEFYQTSVYLEVHGAGASVYKDKQQRVTVDGLGKELTTIKATWEGPLPDSYTETLDGRMIVAKEGL